MITRTYPEPSAPIPRYLHKMSQAQRKDDILGSELPAHLPLMALRSTIVYPLGTIAVQMGAPETLSLLREHEEPGLIVALIVAGFIASLKVAMILLLTATPVALLAGVVELTIGPTVAPPVPRMGSRPPPLPPQPATNAASRKGTRHRSLLDCFANLYIWFPFCWMAVLLFATDYGFGLP